MTIRSEPSVSILLAARNAEGTLPPCLTSIRRQTLTDYECVVVDDGSTDDTYKIATELARLDARFRVLRRSAEGLVAALTAGLSVCRAPLVARMDADDLMHRDRLAAQVAHLSSKPQLAAVGCRVHVHPTPLDGMAAYVTWANSIRTDADVLREAFVECPLVHPTLMIRRELLSYRDAGWPEDYDLILRLLGSGRRCEVIPRRLLVWRESPGRLSRTHPSYTQARFTACKAAFLSTSVLSNTDQYILWGFGGTGKAMRKALAAHGKHPAYIIELDPDRLGQKIHGAPVVPPEQIQDLPSVPLLVSVAGATPRAQIRAFLATRGRYDPRDFVCVA